MDDARQAAVAREASRFWPKVDVADCWEWTAASAQGYGSFARDHAYFGVTTIRAHQWSYEYLVGGVPDGMQLDHLCRNRACVNPDHLEPVTSAENTRRGVAWSQPQRMCRRGLHAMEGDNVRVKHLKSGRRQRLCRACNREAKRRYRQQKKHQTWGTARCGEPECREGPTG